jgi:hypothetical protein
MNGTNRRGKRPQMSSTSSVDRRDPPTRLRRPPPQHPTTYAGTDNDHIPRDALGFAHIQVAVSRNWCPQVVGRLSGQDVRRLRPAMRFVLECTVTRGAIDTNSRGRPAAPYADAGGPSDS